MLITVGVAAGNVAEDVVDAALELLRTLGQPETLTPLQVRSYLAKVGSRCFIEPVNVDDDKSADLTLGFNFTTVLFKLKATSSRRLTLKCYKLAIMGERPREISPAPNKATRRERRLLNSTKVGMTKKVGTI